MASPRSGIPSANRNAILNLASRRPNNQAALEEACIQEPHPLRCWYTAPAHRCTHTYPDPSCPPTVLIPLPCLGSSAQNRVEVLAGDLRFSKLSLEDSGMYQCVAENKHGTIYASAELAVQGKVPRKQGMASGT